MKDKKSIQLVTFNSSGWPQAKDLLENVSSADIVFVQEHKLRGDLFLRALEWASARHWKPFMTEALPSDGTTGKGGVGTFVRSHIEATVPAGASSHVLVPGHCVFFTSMQDLAMGFLLPRNIWNGGIS